MTIEQKKFIYVFMSLLTIAMIGQYFNMFHLSEHYHEFVDQRNFFGMSRFFDTLSNIGFLIVGLIFIKEILLKDEKDINLKLVAIGSILVCFGSGYYHLLPENTRLLWDRLPIAIVFAGILSYSVQINGLIKATWKKQFNIGYLILSIISVLVWYVGQLEGCNWLGLYVFIQFGGIITLMYIAITGKNKEFNKKILLVLIWYIGAKLCEHFDTIIYQYTNEIISGHTIKHILAAIALYQWFPKEKKDKCITRETMRLGFWQIKYT